MGQQAAFCGGTGKFPLRKPQHEYIVRRIQTHFTGACQHHRVQRLRDVPQIRGAQQQAEKILVLRHGDALTAQQPRHLVQQLHHHVPLAGGFLCRRDAPGSADILHLRGLLSLCAQLLQAEIQCPADLFRVGAAHLAAQGIHRRHQLFAGILGAGQVQRIFLGQLSIAEAPGTFGKFRPPRRCIGRPCVGIVFQRADLRLGQGAQAGLGQHGQLLGHVRAPQQCQQCPHRRGGRAELRGGGLVAVQRDLCHAELVPHRSPVQADIAADHRNFSAAHPLPHQAADGGCGTAGLLLPAGGGKQPQLRGAFRRGAAACLQQLGQSSKARGILMAQVPPQQLRGGHLCAVFARQLAQLRRHLLCTGEQFQVPGLHGCAVLAQCHRHGGQCSQHGTHQPLFGRVEGVELVNEHLALTQKVRQLVPGKRSFQPVCRQLQTVSGVHAGARQQAFVALKDERQLAQLRALGAAVPGKLLQLLPGKPGAFQLVYRLCRHLAKSCTAPVAVVVVHVILQFLQRTAHQHRPPGIGQGLHRRAALYRKDMLGQTGEGIAFYHAGKGIAQLPVDTCFGAGGKLLRHQQDAALSRLGTGTDAGIQQGGLAAAGSAQNQFQHFVLLPLIDFCLYCNTKAEIKPPLFFAIPPPLWYTEKNTLHTGKGLCMKILAVDYGDSRTGLATCDRTEFLTTAITPQITLKARNKVAARVCEVAKEIEAEMILIGLPLNMDGTEGERAAKSRKLAKTVELWSGLPVRMWDERQTTCAAADLLDESGTYGSRRKEILDSVSATVILEDYLAWRKEHPGEM